VVTEDVTRAKCWPDLLPALCSAMQESNMMVGKVGRCRLTVSKPVLKLPVVTAISA